MGSLTVSGCARRAVLLVGTSFANRAAEGPGGIVRHPNWVLLSFVVAAILVGLLVQSASISGMAQFNYPDNRIAGLLSSTSALGLGAFTLSLIILVRYKRALMFTDEVVGELKQVTWPTRDETLSASTTVVLTTFFTAGLLAAYDFIWKNLADYFLFTGS